MLENRSLSKTVSKNRDEEMQDGIIRDGSGGDTETHGMRDQMQEEGEKDSLNLKNQFVSNQKWNFHLQEKPV